MTTIDTGAVRAALLSPGLDICSGLGSARTPGLGSACTIAEINLVLTGRLSDGPHPCISEVIRHWVPRIQDAMPAEMRNSVAWREAATGIAGSAGDAEAEAVRRDLILGWMWEALSDEVVLSAIPVQVRLAWGRMLTERTYAAADAAYAAAAAAADAAVYAADAADADAAYWVRRNPAGLLVQLIEAGQS